MASAAELGRLRREVDDPSVTHLAGGVHAAALPQATLASGFDLVATGEGEATIVGLVGALCAGTPVGAVAGLAWIGGDGALVRSAPAERHELDRYPSFAPERGRFGPIELTRGCIYSCRFCQTPYLFKARFRHRSIPSVTDHVDHLAARGLRYVRFITPTGLSYGSDTTAPDLGAVEALLVATRRHLGPGGKVYFGSFPSEVRPEHVTPEAVAMLRRLVDNRGLIIGAQSGSDAVLTEAKRGHGVAEVERAVEVAAAGGFRPDVDLLFGLPGEGDAEAAETVAFAQRLVERGARVHAHTFMPLPGTPTSDAPPGRVTAAVGLDLDRLAARGALYGQWQRQQDVAAELVPLVRRRR